MYAAGINGQIVVDSPQNSQIVRNPDPENPVIKDAVDESQNFMRLMIEQLKNQDPMSPLDSSEFTQQLATINSLEQLISINSVLSQSQRAAELGEATGLLGYYVEGLDANNDLVAGYVDRVEMIDGQATMLIGEQTLLVGQVLSVDELSPADEALLMGYGGEPATGGEL
jgi:flagellar basal-body rod modification protein FlgD